MRVAALVLHYRHWPGIGPCLDRLRAQTHGLERVVVVDNASGDGSVAAIRQAFPWVEMLARPVNDGYGAGMNAGLELVEGGGAAPDAVLLVTHDAWLAPDTVERLARRLGEGERVGAVGPLLGLRDQPERVYSAGGTVDALRWAVGHVADPRRPMMQDWEGLGPRSVGWLDGACVLLDLRAFRQVGPFDERYFLYYEDVDYGIRLRAAGWSPECVPDARAWHRYAPAATFLDYLDTRNRLVLAFSHASGPVRVRALAQSLVGVAREAAGGRPGAAARARARGRGLVDFCRGRLGPPGVVTGRVGPR